MITSDTKRIESLTCAGAWGNKTIHQILAQHVESQPDALAVKDQPNREDLTGDAPISLTWLELDRASDSFASQLNSQGVREGDRVIVQLPNIAELAVAYYAFSKLGAVISPVPVQYSRHELQTMASTLNAKIMISIDRFANLELAANAQQALADIKMLVIGGDLKLDPSNIQKFVSGLEPDANRILTIAWTSGTTGTPKGVPRSHNMWLATGRASAEASSLTADDKMLCPFPLINMAALGGMLIPCLLHGCSLILHHPLDADLMLQQIAQESITFTVVPPAMLNQLAKSAEMWGKYDLNSLRSVGSGSAPLSPWMIETFRDDYGIEVINMYGSNEGIALYATPANAPDANTRATDFRRPDVGESFATKVADPETGEEFTEIGDKGELLVSGATVIDGYFKHDNVDVFSKDGYFRTGDLVEICGEKGQYYRIVGRCKDIINRGGMKISPAEIDVLLESYPGSADAAVCGYPDERLSEKVCACLVLHEGSEKPGLSELQNWLLEKGLAKFKLPERIEVFEALPRNPVGKVQRFRLMDIVSQIVG